MASFGDLKKKLKDDKSQGRGETREPERISQSPTAAKGREITGYSLDECFEKAQSLFQLPLDQLSYEILEEGSKGVLGVGKKLYRLYFSIGTAEELEMDTELKPLIDSKPEPLAPVDGVARMVMRISGAYIKVSPPERGGQSVTFEEAVNVLVNKSFTRYNGGQIKDIVKEASGEWVKVGDYVPNSEYDSHASIEISNDEMKAFITVSAPILTGRILEDHEIQSLIDEAGIVYGVNKDKIKEILEEEHFNAPILIAEGTPPVHGEAAIINFHFKTETDTIQLEEDDFGKVDYFSDLGRIQNVVAGQILAVKTLPTQGQDGKNVVGNVVEANDGEDVPFEAGKNADLSENGMEVIAQAAGRAVFKDGIIEVEPIFEVKGNVGLKTGSVVFLGDVIVSENVEDGFSVKAAGNIYIGGTINKSEVEADGDIVVQRGILGKEEGFVKAGGNIFAKFIENSKVKAGGKVVAGEGILHSYVDAKQVYSLGKRGTITGGHIRTVEEVNAKTIGSTTYTETRIEAGIDPVAKEKLVKFEDERESIEENLSKLSANLMTMQNQKRSLGNLSPEREVMLERMLRAKKEFESQLKEITLDTDELRSYLGSLTSQGKVSGDDKVYPGSEVTIKNTTLKIKNDYTHVTFILEGGEIRAAPYQEPRDKSVRTAQKGKKRR